MPSDSPPASFPCDRARAARLLDAAGLDALVIAEPEGFRYVTGVPQGLPALFRRTGAGFAVLPADPAMPIGAVVGDLHAEAARALIPDVATHPLWMESANVSGQGSGTIETRIAAGWGLEGREPGFRRPATFDLGRALEALHGVLGARGLADGRLGFDLDYVAANDLPRLRTGLPGATIADGSRALDRLRMVKTPLEIARLRLGVELAEVGLRAMEAGVREGQVGADLHDLFRAGLEGEAARRAIAVPPSWDYIAIGSQPWTGRGRVEAGAIIKADVGCVVEGYSSDTSRNYVFGAPSEDQRRLHLMLERAFDAGWAEIRPAQLLKAAHLAATRSLERDGLVGFSRGHFGHGLGHSLFSEQWPFISADEDTPFEPDMVMAFEIPIYVTGLGGFNLEDQLIVTPEGAVSMNTLPRTLVRLGP